MGKKLFFLKDRVKEFRYINTDGMINLSSNSMNDSKVIVKREEKGNFFLFFNKVDVLPKRHFQQTKEV